MIEQVGRPLDLYREPANRFVATFVGSPAINVWAGEDSVERGVRAEDVQVSPVAAAGFTEARVLVVEPMGNETIVTLAAGDRRVVARVPPALELAPGVAAWFAFDPGRTLFFDAATGRASRNGAGRRRDLTAAGRASKVASVRGCPVPWSLSLPAVPSIPRGHVQKRVSRTGPRTVHAVAQEQVNARPHGTGRRIGGALRPAVGSQRGDQGGDPCGPTTRAPTSS